MNPPSMWHIFKGNEYNMLPTSNENIYHDQKEIRYWYLWKLFGNRTQNFKIYINIYIYLKDDLVRTLLFFSNYTKIKLISNKTDISVCCFLFQILDLGESLGCEEQLPAYWYVNK